jgi:hypothetical protein
MYLTAHRVVRPSTGEEGINAFFYLHGALVWDGLPPEGIPDREPGELTNEHVELQPPGNRVRSYVDIVAPDETPWTEVRPAFVAFVTKAQASPLPWEGVVGRCYFRVGLEQALVAAWQSEFAKLFQAAQSVRVGAQA